MVNQVNALTNEELVVAIGELVAKRRLITAELVEHIGELDARRLYAEYACSSTFRYCLTLGLSEACTLKLIQVARMARQYPRILDMLRAGDTHLSNVLLLAKHLTDANHRDRLDAIRHKSKRQVEKLIAQWFPSPTVPDKIRKLPTPARKVDALQAPQTPQTPQTSTSEEAVEAFTLAPPPVARKPSEVKPLAPAAFKVQFTADQELCDNIEKAKALLGPSMPRGDLNALFGRAMRLLVEDLERKKYGKTKKPRAKKAKKAERNRHIPAAVRREVYERDDGQCTFVDERGNRCQERWGLELDHVEPYAKGGQNSTDNIRLRCRVHNRREAEREFGADFILAKIAARRSKTPTRPGAASVVPVGERRRYEEPRSLRVQAPRPAAST